MGVDPAVMGVGAVMGVAICPHHRPREGCGQHRLSLYNFMWVTWPSLVIWNKALAFWDIMYQMGRINPTLLTFPNKLCFYQVYILNLPTRFRLKKRFCVMDGERGLAEII